jgi:predicted enzyme related to lactoylglutathione lyase
MSMQLSKSAVDVGFISTNGEQMVKFYGGVLGLSQDEDVTIPNYGTIHKFNCGDSIVRVMVPEVTPENVAGGDFMSRNGIRYITFNIDNLDEVVQACKDFGCNIAVDIRDLRPGVRCAQIQDPDGNYVEFISATGGQ